MKNKADIFHDRKAGDVVVIDERGKEIFRRKRSEQIISIAHSIYLAHKYKEK